MYSREVPATVKVDDALLKCMRLMEESGQPWRIVTGDKSKTLGVITDGDIRRFLLSGGSLEAVVRDAMTKKFEYALTTTTDEELINLLARWSFLPIVTKDMELVEVATIKRLHETPILDAAIGVKELEQVSQALVSGWISSKSPVVHSFEAAFEQKTGLTNCLAVANGTVAIEIALRALGIGLDDEVLVPDLTFAATANAVANVGAKPILVDVDLEDFGMNAALALAAVGAKTKGAILVHLYGQPMIHTRELVDALQKRGIRVIEDCAEALGSRIGNDHVGSFGDAATFSFFGNKLITTGEGGMVSFTEVSDFGRAKLIRDHGQSPTRKYWHEVVGTNSRLTGIQAALGIAQLEKFETFLESKIETARAYQRHLRSSNEVKVYTSNFGISSYWLNVLQLDPLIYTRAAVGDLSDFLRERGIETRPLFHPLHTMPAFSQQVFLKQSGEARSVRLHSYGLCLPSSSMQEVHVTNRVCEAILSWVSLERERVN